MQNLIVSNRQEKLKDYLSVTIDLWSTYDPIQNLHSIFALNERNFNVIFWELP